ncbi:helix-turn-helix domain-containing protein [Leisingera sp.]|uniref:helix-turn-helix domain-containing protein n=1 Tax=Leisingera sp. TaxID=1879318 RepID=UPI002B266B76|nr:helix-turn-helix domain-containing protein [Leisingera sp.]
MLNYSRTCRNPLTVLDIAAAGCSNCTLQTGFRQIFDLTPVVYLPGLQLCLAHYLLLLRPAETPAHSIADHWGVSHLGRFSQLYRTRFGELPSTKCAAPGKPEESSGSALAR